MSESGSVCQSVASIAPFSGNSSPLATLGQDEEINANPVPSPKENPVEEQVEPVKKPKEQQEKHGMVDSRTTALTCPKCMHFGHVTSASTEVHALRYLHFSISYCTVVCVCA